MIVASLIVIVLSHGAPKQIHISQADVIGSEMFVSYLASRIFPDAVDIPLLSIANRFSFLV